MIVLSAQPLPAPETSLLVFKVFSRSRSAEKLACLLGHARKYFMDRDTRHKEMTARFLSRLAETPIEKSIGEPTGEPTEEAGNAREKEATDASGARSQLGGRDRSDEMRAQRPPKKTESESRSPGRLATCLLVAMGGFAVGVSLPVWRRLYGQPLWLDMLRGGTQAGVVGGLADWFAVTALFRHPLGLPIPHTAILPRRKAALGAALGRFVAEHFFTDADVARVLARCNFADLVANALEEPQTFASVSAALRSVIPALCARLEDGSSEAAIKKIVPQLLSGVDLNPLLLRAMQAMVEGEVHQEVFSFFLAQFKELIMTREADLRDFVAARVREQGGRLVGWALGGAVANQVLDALKMELERVDPMDSDLRSGFTKWVRGKIGDMAEHPERARALVQALGGFFGHESLREWGGGLWQRMRVMALEDSADPNGWSAQAFEALLTQIITTLKNNGPLAQKLDQAVTQSVLRLMPGIRREITQLIPRVVESWDGPGLSARLEAGVGRDLAYIRVNGTVVGFVVGALLEGALGYLARG